MTPALPLLAFDTSAAHCSAHLMGCSVHTAYEPLKRGQAERLLPMCEELLAEADLTWKDLHAIAVGVGPGNFTGIRIAVSAARGLGLGLGVPVVGVSGFRQLLQGHGYSTRVLVSLPAPRDQAYVQPYLGMQTLSPPRQISPGEMIEDLQQPGLCVVGYQAEAIADGLGATADSIPWDQHDPTITAAVIAAAAQMSLNDPSFQPTKPAPLYVRAADAAPPRDPAPVIVP